ncbi:RUS1 family protein C16orf58 homolog [Melanotaenia boesemani]|uniref:RUS1 family protein C16orf58 homolog n=1 Tax=Melanotaenia boesemani TaxID=1250792 RepID=UPI001C054DE7|nr:RUS1 family protein C16orf58 homolog [Melanotaenia boesemani]
MRRGGGAVLATERYGSAQSWKYLEKDGMIERTRDGREGETRSNSVVGVFKSVFLPQGYPDSVSDDYLQYQFWDTLQAFSSSLSGTLATQASLKGVGVGNQEATVAAATATWLLRDGTGMLGRILFAWQKGTKLDSEAKKWRLFADVLNDIAMFMEILAPYFPTCFTLIVCTAGIFKSIVGVAGGATRAALTVHQARRDNMADISAKDGSQETLVNLAGLLVSLILIPLVTDNAVLTLSLFFLFTILHLFANYKAVRSVVMETFNEARLSIVLQQYLKDKRILSPIEANQKEPVFLEFGKTAPIKLGVRLQDVVQSQEELNLALKENNMPYLLGIRNGCVCVCLGPEASVRNEIRAVCQAVWLSNMLSHPTSREPICAPMQQTKGLWKMVHESFKLMDANFDPFLKGVEAAGWDIKRTLLDWDEWRVEWKTKSS